MHSDAYTPYPSLLGSDTLVVGGEEPGKIEGVLFQEMLAAYLNATTSRDMHYDTNTQGRLTNNTMATTVLNLIENEEGCEPGEFWEGDIETCLSCPLSFDVTFSKEALEFQVLSKEEALSEVITLKNHEQFGVAVIPKRLPKWLGFSYSGDTMLGDDAPTPLGPGETMNLKVEIDPRQLEEGTTHLTIGFGLLDGGDYPGCVAQDATFDVTTRVYPMENKNYLGGIRAVGLSLFAIIAFTSISFASFVLCHREQQIVRALQPVFLVTICFGVFVMGSALIPLSIDDEIATQKGCDVKCMALPWLLCMGFSIAMSALIAKLWRINQLFNARNTLRRFQVRAKDV